jgi:hypothetical protein
MNRRWKTILTASAALACAVGFRGGHEGRASAQEAAAIATLARVTKKALYLEALTKEDWEHHVDRARTDGSMKLRPASFYRRALAPHFLACGGGLYVPHTSPVVLFELEKGR